MVPVEQTKRKTLEEGICVIICTYNGAQRLVETLTHLAQQVVKPDLNWEIIVVDNGSKDNSVETAKLQWSKYTTTADFKVINESNSGKINALARGVSQCKYSLFVICDDDNWLSPNYVQHAYTLLQSDKRIGAVGGLSIAVNDGQGFPSWFETYQEGYAVGPQGSHKGDITTRGYLFGAGMATRTDLFNLAYANFPSILVGRQENKLSAGEDSEYCQRLILMGYTLFYDPAMYFHHYMPTSRLTESYKRLLFEGLNESNLILHKYLLITKLKLKIEKSNINKLRLMIITPLRTVFTLSKKKKKDEMNALRYLFNLKFTEDAVFRSIIKFEKTFSK